MSALLLVACSEPEAPVRPTAAPASSVPVVAPRPLAAPPAFALVPTGEGALLVWSRADAISALSLGARGQPRGEEMTIASGRASELDAASVGGRVGIAWVTEELATRATYSHDGGHTFAPIDELGPSVAGVDGRLAVGGADEAGIAVYHRIPEAPCVASSGTCARFTRRGLGRDRLQAERGNEPLEIERPCDPLLAGALYRAGTWFYGICNVATEPRVTVYAIRPAIAWAAPYDSDGGCLPVGMAPLESGVAVFAECGRGLRAIELDGMGREVGRFEPVERRARCAEGRPVFELSADGRTRTITLAEASDHLEWLAPESIAPRGARAIWTGEALLVANARRGEVAVRRFRCAGARLADDTAAR